MNNIKVSVIIPMYNMETYIEQTIESVEAQSMRNEIEIIIVDDGSTDKSISIVQRMNNMYSNISLLRQDNAGSGAARNLGIQIAKGEYLAFLDADDLYYRDNSLEILYHAARCNQALICGGKSFDLFHGKVSSDGVRAERKIGEDRFIDASDYPGVSGFWACIFKREFILDNSIFFPEYKRGQDAAFFVTAIAKAGKIFRCKECVHLYRKNHKTVIFDKEKAIGLVCSFRDILSVARNYHMDKVYDGALNEFRGEVGALLYTYAEESEVLQGVLKDMEGFLGGTEHEKLLLYSVDDIQQYKRECLLDKEQLIQEWKQKKVYIYGAGTIGIKVLRFFKANGIEVVSFFVSNPGSNLEEIEGVPVHVFSEHISEASSKDAVVIVSGFWYNQNQIVEILKNYRLTNFYTLDLMKFFLWQDSIVH